MDLQMLGANGTPCVGQWNVRAFGLLPPILSKPSVAKAPSVTQLIGLFVVVVLVSFLVLWLVLVRYGSLHSLLCLLFVFAGTW